MKTVQEGDLIFDVSEALNYEKFDDNKLHGTKSTMKRVDFIIENQGHEPDQKRRDESKSFLILKGMKNNLLGVRIWRIS